MKKEWEESCVQFSGTVLDVFTPSWTVTPPRQSRLRLMVEFHPDHQTVDQLFTLVGTVGDGASNGASGVVLCGLLGPRLNKRFQ